MIKAIETSYAGCRFRSRLEARWAVFFDHLGIGWQYEPQGFMIGDRPYLPDFLLECGTWVEVKGDEKSLDHDLMLQAAEELPRMPATCEHGPQLLILGPIPRPPLYGELGWMGLDLYSENNGVWVEDHWLGFSAFDKNRRPWWLTNTSCAPPWSSEHPLWLTPVVDPSEDGSSAAAAYTAARSARFEHGQHGA